MPVLHQYRNRGGWFVRTIIQNSIITFQLTEEGVKRLLESGVEDGEKFRRAILFNLWKAGEAFTHGTGPGTIESYTAGKSGQLAFDFPDDPEPDTIFPRCSSCGSLDGLHLIEISEEQRHYASIHCPKCREKHRTQIDMSIPLLVITRGMLAKALELQEIEDLDGNAAGFSQSLDAAFNNRWDALLESRIRGKREEQKPLFGTEGKQRKLL